MKENRAKNIKTLAVGKKSTYATQHRSSHIELAREDLNEAFTTSSAGRALGPKSMAAMRRSRGEMTWTLGEEMTLVLW